MEHGICPYSVVSVQASATSKSEQLTQLLFGEVFTVLEESENGQWWRIEIKHDTYQGWVEKQRIQRIDEAIFNNANIVFSADSMGYAIETETRKRILLPACSVFHDYEGGTFHQGGKLYEYKGAVISGQKEISKQNIEPFLDHYMLTPYLWGGRHPLGIDCSGLTQNIMRLCGFSLPRDSTQQAELRKIVGSTEVAEYEDLAFFSNGGGQINHVGIVTENNMVIHAAECVKPGRLDNQGIFDLEKQAYSHDLRMIKRL